MAAPSSRIVPSTVASCSSRRWARISLLVRSSAVRCGARSTQPAPMVTLLISPIVMSMLPVTSQRPRKATSAATES